MGGRELKREGPRAPISPGRPAPDDRFTSTSRASSRRRAATKERVNKKEESNHDDHSGRRYAKDGAMCRPQRWPGVGFDEDEAIPPGWPFKMKEIKWTMRLHERLVDQVLQLSVAVGFPPPPLPPPLQALSLYLLRSRFAPLLFYLSLDLISSLSLPQAPSLLSSGSTSALSPIPSVSGCLLHPSSQSTRSQLSNSKADSTHEAGLTPSLAQDRAPRPGHRRRDEAYIEEGR